jgi:hypothetical protein
MWDDLKTRDLEILNLKFGDIECSENPTLCATLIGTSYPQVMWFDPQFNVTQRFDSQRTIPNLVQFARALQVWPFEFAEDIDSALSLSSPWSPLPFISLPQASANDTLKFVKTVFCKLKKKAVIQCVSKSELVVLRNSSQKLVFEGKWTDDELFEWLKRATLSPYELLTEDMLAIVSERDNPFVHFFVDRKKKTDKFLRFVDGLPNHQYTYSVC